MGLYYPYTTMYPINKSLNYFIKYISTIELPVNIIKHYYDI